MPATEFTITWLSLGIAYDLKTIKRAAYRSTFGRRRCWWLSCCWAAVTLHPSEKRYANFGGRTIKTEALRASTSAFSTLKFYDSAVIATSRATINRHDNTLVKYHICGLAACALSPQCYTHYPARLLCNILLSCSCPANLGPNAIIQTAFRWITLDVIPHQR